jgi:hypothetical protein
MPEPVVVKIEWEGIETRSGLWCAICALPSAVSIVGALRVGGGDLRLVAIEECCDCGLRSDPLVEEDIDDGDS